MKELILENPPGRRRRRSRKTKTAMSRKSASRKSASRKSSTLRRRRYSTNRTRRHKVRFSGFSVRANPFNLRGVFSSGNLAIAGGAVAATLVSNLAVAQLGRFLPMVNTPLGRGAYNVGIPVIAAMLTRRFAPNLATGMIIGGLANGIGQAITATGILPAASVPAPSLPAAATTQAANEYLGEYLGCSENRYAEAVAGAFENDAWA